jgi:hypothetical protein
MGAGTGDLRGERATNASAGAMPVFNKISDGTYTNHSFLSRSDQQSSAVQPSPRPIALALLQK